MVKKIEEVSRFETRFNPKVVWRPDPAAPLSRGMFRFLGFLVLSCDMVARSRLFRDHDHGWYKFLCTKRESRTLKNRKTSCLRSASLKPIDTHAACPCHTHAITCLMPL